MNLKLITPQPKYELYHNAFTRAIHAYKPSDDEVAAHTLLKQLVIYGVKYIINFRFKKKNIKTKEEIEYNFDMIQLIKATMTSLTPNDIVNLFPITKEYDGEKYCMKDYFSTIESLKSYDMDKPLGHKLTDFLWDYQNIELSEFMVNAMCSISDMRRLQGEKGVFEEFAEKQGIDTYTVNKTDGYIINNTTKTLCRLFSIVQVQDIIGKSKIQNSSYIA